MKKLLFILLLAAFSHDILADSFDGCCMPERNPVCHCVCQVHFVAPASPTPHRTEPKIERMPAHFARISTDLLPKELFSPPKTLA